MKILSKRERDMEVYEFFQALLHAGKTIMEATYMTMSQYGISSNSTLLNIRKRVENDKRRTNSK